MKEPFLNPKKWAYNLLIDYLVSAGAAGAASAGAASAAGAPSAGAAAASAATAGAASAGACSGVDLEQVKPVVNASAISATERRAFIGVFPFVNTRLLSGLVIVDSGSLI